MNRIRVFRRQANITQEELAKAVGASQVRICRWETGKIKVPWEIKERLVKVLGLPEEPLSQVALCLCSYFKFRARFKA
ncbi:unnamed protein product [marine sediment metagenome]|uniref:HTH cro/C1-type domain-containing protein n=1 Tax=marine sediment metagenome TaxID=412755 RepID=X1SAU0_9ZZZZ